MHRRLIEWQTCAGLCFALWPASHDVTRRDKARGTPHSAQPARVPLTAGALLQRVDQRAAHGLLLGACVGVPHAGHPGVPR